MKRHLSFQSLAFFQCAIASSLILQATSVCAATDSSLEISSDTNLETIPALPVAQPDPILDVQPEIASTLEWQSSPSDEGLRAQAESSVPIADPPDNPEIDPESISQPSSTPIPVLQPTPTVEPSATLKSTLTDTTTRDSLTEPASSTHLSPKVKIITPTVESVLDVPAATVTIQFPANQTVELRVNDVPVDPSLIGRTETDSSMNLTTQTWYGVSLKEGGNTISAAIAGAPVTTVSVQVRGAAEKLAIETVETKIPADGRSTATVRGQLLDANGNRSNREAMITLISSAGEFVGTDAAPDQIGFQVKATQGQFNATLKSGLEAKTVRVRASMNDLEAFTQLNFETHLRSSVATGVIDLRLGRRGINFYENFRLFLPADGDYSTELDLKASVFTTGRLGNWLVTGAYNSDRPLNKTCDGGVRLFRDQQFCDHTYSVYGDSSQSTILTPSTDQVYLRLERTSPTQGAGTDFAMWGDYRTEEFATRSQEFSAMNRQLHGFKGNYNLGNLQLTGFYANNIEGFQRETIAPDGTSGYYFLSRRLLQEGSEDVFLELEELNRPGTVIKRERLNRGPDYEIDYTRGTLLFREPILRTDIGKEGEALVRRIVVTYQYEQVGTDTDLFGGRLQYHFSRQQGQERWLGATYYKEDRGSRDFELYGADAYISLGTKQRLIAEYARSHNVSDIFGSVEGSAYRVELEGELFKGVHGRALYRSADTGFANNATTSFVPGQTRYQAQVTAKVSPTTNLRLQYDHEENSGIAPQRLNTLTDLLTPRLEATPGTRVDNSLTMISAGLQQKFGAADLTVDWLHRDRSDRLNPAQFNTKSDQLRSRLSVPLSKRLTFLAQNETTLSSQVDAVYSDRTLLGLNWQAIPGVNVQLSQQFFTRGQLAGKSITSLGLSGDYKLWDNTTLTGRYSIFGGDRELVSQGALGVKQKIILSPGLRMDLAYEHTFGTSGKRLATGTPFLQPFAPAQSAASLGLQDGDSYSIGVDYVDSPRFQASARYEHRSSSQGNNTVISAGATGKLSPSLTALIRYQQASASNQKLSALGDTANLKVGLAYRDPKHDRFNALLRYEYRKNPATLPDSILYSSGNGSEDHLFGLEALYAPNWRWEFYGKFALRNSKSYLAKDLAGSNTVTLTQARARYQLGYRWDVVGEARWIHQPSANFSETGWVAELGYYLSPNLRLAAGYSFGKTHDRDFDGSRSASGPYLGLTVKVNDLFNGFGLQRVKRSQPEQPVESPPVSVPTSEPAPPEAISPPVFTPPPTESSAPPPSSEIRPVRALW